MLLTVSNLSKNFGGLMAISEVDFAVKKGQIAAIIGPNGSGKTTFFNVVSGIYKPLSGKIIFNGEDITNLPVHERARRGIARTFQTTTLFSNATVLDNVIVGYRLRTKTGLWDVLARTARFHQDEKKSRQKAWEVLEFTGLDKLAHQQVENIPQEAKKRVAIAMALATDPQLIMLDEPAAGINFDETAGIIELIRKMQKQGLTVCLIEHKMQMVMNLADYIMVLNQGIKIAEGTPEEVANNQVVIEAYLGSDDDAEND